MKTQSERSEERSNKVATHTPTPYTLAVTQHEMGGCSVEIFADWGDAKPLVLARAYGWKDRTYNLALANAEFIVRACNSHDELVEALRYIASRSYLASENLAQVALRALAKAEEVVSTGRIGDDAEGKGE